MDFGFAGGRSNEYYDGLLSFGDHMFVDEDVVTKHQVDSRLPTTGTLTELMPDVARKDFPDDSITVDPMKYDRWISDATGLRVHHDARKRKRQYNAEGYRRAKSIFEDPKPKPLFEPTTSEIDKLPHWTTDARVLFSQRGGHRDTTRMYKSPIYWQAIYENKLPNKAVQDIEREMLEMNRYKDWRLFDCSGNCR